MRKNPTFLPLLLVAVVAIGAAWTLAGRDRGDAPAGTAADPSAPPPSGWSDPDAAPQASARAVSPPARRAIPPGSPHSILAAPRDPAEVQAERDRLLAMLEEEHRSQPVDAAWAGPAEQALDELRADPGLDASGMAPDAYRSDCRSSSCRISADFATHADAEDWAMLYITLTGSTFQRTRSMVIRRPDGGFEARIYGARR